MNIGWGWKISILYGGFVILIAGLVTASSRQKIDLVSKDYYKDEIKYQEVIDASRSQANLSGAMVVHAGNTEVVVEFPEEFRDKILSGKVTFYSIVNQDWDRSFDIHTDGNKMSIPRSVLQHTAYEVKISYTADQRKYFYTARINLN